MCENQDATKPSLECDDVAGNPKEYTAEQHINTMLAMTPPKQNQPKLMYCYDGENKSRLLPSLYNNSQKYYCNGVHQLQHRSSPKHYHNGSTMLPLPRTMKDYHTYVKNA